MRELSELRSSTRKEDARHKIMLGGLVIKAGLGGQSPALILGLLLAGKSALDDPAQRAKLIQLGGKALR